jgi:hypothetical protein
VIPKLQTSRDVKKKQGCLENAPLLQQLCVAFQHLKIDGSKCPPTSLAYAANYDLDFWGPMELQILAFLCQTCYIT